VLRTNKCRPLHRDEGWRRSFLRSLEIRSAWEPIVAKPREDILKGGAVICKEGAVL
jgi:hypothetical protein